MAAHKVNLDRLLCPASVAVIGASHDPSTISGKPLHYLITHEFPGAIFPVNPRRDSIAGYRCYPDVQSLPETPDLALIALNASQVPDAVRECGKKGVKFAVVLASGFAEAGDDGARLQRDLQDAAREYDVAIVGPNCNGLLNVPGKLYAGFPSVFGLSSFRSGPVSLVSQSGGLGFGLFGLAEAAGIGFRHVVSVGNEAVLGTLDFLEYFVEDAETRVIVAYLEGLKDARRFRAVAERALRQEKPILVIKAAGTEAGRKAAAAHTANLSAGGVLYEILFAQCGVVRIDDVDQIIDFVKVFEHGKAPAGNRVAVVTTTAGTGVVVADTCSRGGIELPTLSERSRAELQRILPSYGSLINPIDVTATIHNKPDLLMQTLDVVASDDSIDSLIVINGSRDGQVGVATARAIVNVSSRTRKPVVVCWFAREELASEAYAVLAANRIPRYETPLRTGRALAMLVEYHRRRRAISNADAPDSASRARSRQAPAGPGHAWMTEYDSKKLLAGLGLPITREELASSAAQAAQAGARIGFPVALKVVSKDLPHKTDAGGVILDLRSADAVLDAYRAIEEQVSARHPEAKIEAMLVQEMVPQGVEIIVGALNDSVFGPAVMVGSGGILVELLNDAVFRLAPVSLSMAHEMLREMKGFALLAGVRGAGAADIDALAQLIVSIGRFITDNEDVEAIDINPVMVLGQGAGVKVVDALARFRTP